MEFKKSVKRALGQAFQIAGLDRHTIDSTLSIVAFHRIDDDLAADSLTCTSAQFESFCRHFRDHFAVVPLAQQVAACHSGRPMGGTLSITFDDGYLDNYTVAAPILERLGLTATFFVVSEFIGSTTIAPWDRHMPNHPGWMNWTHVRNLVQRGFDIGGHTATHLDMGQASSATIANELTSSKAKIEHELNREIELFAYPFGGPEHITETARELVRDAGFRCCVSCHFGINPSVADPFRLHRLPISTWYADPLQMTAELVISEARTNVDALRIATRYPLE